MAKTIMIQGTGSSVGKSVVTTALCRIFYQDGFKVAPFKAQNMALNSYITKEGGEMGRSQVVQAEACGIEPHVDMNPVLLKPTSDQGSQVIIQGKVRKNFQSMEYEKEKRNLLVHVKQSFERLAEKYQIIVIEGAGSPAEVNLKKNDIVNMRMALLSNAPVILVGDIDRGGVFAWMVGTLALLTEDEVKRVKGFMINKFRGDRKLLQPGLDFLENKTGKPILGVIPYFRDIYIEEEDSVSLEKRGVSFRPSSDKIDIVVLSLPHISNFTDFDLLAREELVSLRYIHMGESLGEADAIMIPGSKNTIDDLSCLYKYSYPEQIKKRLEKGAVVFGLCGGYQMMGLEIRDPHHTESRQQKIKGLGLYQGITILDVDKITYQTEARVLSNPFIKCDEPIRGYEIHTGRTIFLEREKFFLQINKRGEHIVHLRDGILGREGKVWGTYLHGIFDQYSFRKSFLNYLGKRKGLDLMGEEVEVRTYSESKEREYDKLAELFRKNLDMARIYHMLKMTNVRHSL